MQKEILRKGPGVGMSLKDRETDTKTTQVGNRNQRGEDDDARLVGGAGRRKGLRTVLKT